MSAMADGIRRRYALATYSKIDSFIMICAWNAAAIRAWGLGEGAQSASECDEEGRKGKEACEVRTFG